MPALQRTAPLNLSFWISLARFTRPLMVSDVSSAGLPGQLAVAHGEDLDVDIDPVKEGARNFRPVTAVSDEGRTGTASLLSVKYPQGQGFMAATSMKRAGYVTDARERDTVMEPFSKGCRSTSRTFLLNSGCVHPERGRR